MLRPLAKRDPYTCYVTTCLETLKRLSLIATLEQVWGEDYSHDLRISHDDRLLARLAMSKGTWVAFCICDDTGELVGFELVLRRTLYWHSHPLNTYYNRLFSIAPPHRRQGLAQWLMHCINTFLFEDGDAELVFLAFHAGKAGLPAVRKAHTDLPNMQLKLFRDAAIWGRHLIKTALPSIEKGFSATHLTLQPDANDQIFNNVESLPTPPIRLRVDRFIDGLTQHYQVAFGPQHSYRVQYFTLSPDTGTYWYSFPDAQCSISYDLVNMTQGSMLTGRMGRIQAMQVHNCTSHQLYQALTHICHLFRCQGCYLASLVDLGVVPHSVLHALRFRITNDMFRFAIRGPRSTIDACNPVSPPFFFDT